MSVPAEAISKELQEALDALIDSYKDMAAAEEKVKAISETMEKKGVGLLRFPGLVAAAKEEHELPEEASPYVEVLELAQKNHAATSIDFTDRLKNFTSELNPLFKELCNLSKNPIINPEAFKSDSSAKNAKKLGCFFWIVQDMFSSREMEKPSPKKPDPARYALHTSKWTSLQISLREVMQAWQPYVKDKEIEFRAEIRPPLSQETRMKIEDQIKVLSQEAPNERHLRNLKPKNGNRRQLPKMYQRNKLPPPTSNATATTDHAPPAAQVIITSSTSNAAGTAAKETSTAAYGTFNDYQAVPAVSVSSTPAPTASKTISIGEDPAKGSCPPADPLQSPALTTSVSPIQSPQSATTNSLTTKKIKKSSPKETLNKDLAEALDTLKMHYANMMLAEKKRNAVKDAVEEKGIQTSFAPLEDQIEQASTENKPYLQSLSVAEKEYDAALNLFKEHFQRLILGSLFDTLKHNLAQGAKVFSKEDAYRLGLFIWIADNQLQLETGKKIILDSMPHNVLNNSCKKLIKDWKKYTKKNTSQFNKDMCPVIDKKQIHEKITIAAASAESETHPSPISSQTALSPTSNDDGDESFEPSLSQQSPESQTTSVTPKKPTWARIKRLTARITTLEGELKKINEELTDTRAKNSELASALNTQTTTMTRLQSEKSELEKGIAQLKGNLAEKTQDINALQERHNLAEKQLTLNVGDKKRLEDDLKKALDAKTNLQDQLAKKQQMLTEKEKENASQTQTLKAILKEQEKVLGEKNLKIHDLTIQLKEANNQLKSNTASTSISIASKPIQTPIESTTKHKAEQDAKKLEELQNKLREQSEHAPKRQPSEDKATKSTSNDQAAQTSVLFSASAPGSSASASPAASRPALPVTKPQPAAPVLAQAPAVVPLPPPVVQSVIVPVPPPAPSAPSRVEAAIERRKKRGL